MATNEVEIRVTADTKGAERGLKGMRGSLAKFSKSAKIAGAALTGIAAGGFMLMKSFGQAALVQEHAQNTLAAVMAKAGESYASMEEQILSVTSALQKKTNFGDEAQIAVLAQLVPMLGNTEDALAALPAVMEVAALTSSDLESVVRTMGPVLAGVTDRLRGTTLEFEKSQGPMERVEKIMDKIGGTAEAQVDPFMQMGNAIGDVKEKIGEGFLPVLKPLLGMIQRLAEWFQELNPRTLKIISTVIIATVAFAGIAGPILLLIGLLPILIGGFTALAGAALPITLAIAGIAAAVAAGLLIWNNWNVIVETVKEVFKDVSSTLSDLFRSRLGWILPGGLLIKGLLFIKDNWTNIWNGIRRTFQSVVRQIEELINSWVSGFIKAINLVIGGVNILREALGEDAIKTVGEFEFSFSKAFEAVKNTVKVVGEFVVNQVGDIKERFGQLIKRTDDLKKETEDIFDPVIEKGKEAEVVIDNVAKSLGRATKATFELNAATASQITPVGGGAGGGMPGVFLTGGGQGAFSGIPGINDPALWTSLLQGFLAGNPTPNQTEKALFMRRHAAFGAPPTFVKDTLSSQPFIDQFLKVRGFAHGGIVTRPTLAMIGEAGPEAVVPLGGGRGMAPTYNISISGNTVFGEMDFKRLVVDAVTDSHRRGGLPFLGRA